MKSLSTGRCGANAASSHLEAKHRRGVGREDGRVGSAWDKERAAPCELQSGDGFCKQKSESKENSGERGQMYFSPCVFHLVRTRFLSLALLFVGFLPHTVGISEYKNGLKSHRKPDPSKLVFLQHLQKPRALSQARRRDQWLALLARA